jgi:hypothetical protein
MTSLALVVLALLGQAAWRDPAPHQVRLVEVEPSVRVEVLDFGGTGRPIVFLGAISPLMYSTRSRRS